MAEKDAKETLNPIFVCCVQSKRLCHLRRTAMARPELPNGAARLSSRPGETRELHLVTGLVNHLSSCEVGILLRTMSVVDINETIILVPYFLMKLLRLIWRPGTRRFHLRVPGLQMSSSGMAMMRWYQDRNPENSRKPTCPFSLYWK